MALPISQIAQIYSHRFYEFKVYISPQDFPSCLNSLKEVTVKSVKRLKFEYDIVTKIPAKKKGFYVFTLEEFGFPSINFTYLLYIGRVTKTNTFKNRFYKYRNAIGDSSAAEICIL